MVLTIGIDLIIEEFYFFYLKNSYSQKIKPCDITTCFSSQPHPKFQFATLAILNKRQKLHVISPEAQVRVPHCNSKVQIPNFPTITQDNF